MLGVVVLYLATVHSPLVRNLEAKLLDLRFQLRGERSPAAPVAIVLIDEKSSATLGRWPWSRHRFSGAVRRLHAAGARVIAFDVLLSEAEANPAREALQGVRQAFEALDPVSRNAALQDFHQMLVTLTTAEDPDHELATTLNQAGNVLLAVAFDVAGPAVQSRGPTTSPPPCLSLAAYRTVRRPGPKPHHQRVDLGPCTRPRGHAGTRCHPGERQRKADAHL